MRRVDLETEHSVLYAKLTKNILVLHDGVEEGKVIGRLHMQVSMLVPAKPSDNDCDIRLNSGLVELRLRAPTIGEKCKWHNALSNAIKLEQEIWPDFLNLSFATNIFQKDSDYVRELGSIQAARAQIEEAMNQVILKAANIQVYDHVCCVFEALDMHRIAAKRCVDIMEAAREEMYLVAKRMVEMKDILEASKRFVEKPVVSDAEHPKVEDLPCKIIEEIDPPVKKFEFRIPK